MSDFLTGVFKGTLLAALVVSTFYFMAVYVLKVNYDNPDAQFVLDFIMGFYFVFGATYFTHEQLRKR